MIDLILSAHSPQKPFPISGQLKRIKKLGMDYPVIFDEIIELDRDSVLNIVEAPSYSTKEKFFAILLWGIFFEVAQKQPKLKLLQWLDSPNVDRELKRRFDRIINEKSPSALFDDFNAELKIPGLGYAYFTKIFYFIRKANNEPVYPILDKWLMCAFCAVSGSLYGNREVYMRFMKPKHGHKFDGILRRKKSTAYQEYVTFIHKLSIQYQMEVDVIEEKLFGVSLKEDKTENNPRIMYLNWALSSDLDI